MSDIEKAAGLMGSALISGVAIAIGEMEVFYSFAGIFTLLLAGKPIIKKLAA